MQLFPAKVQHYRLGRYPGLRLALFLNFSSHTGKSCLMSGVIQIFPPKNRVITFRGVFSPDWTAEKTGRSQLRGSDGI